MQTTKRLFGIAFLLFICHSCNIVNESSDSDSVLSEKKVLNEDYFNVTVESDTVRTISSITDKRNINISVTESIEGKYLEFSVSIVKETFSNPYSYEVFSTFVIHDGFLEKEYPLAKNLKKDEEESFSYLNQFQVAYYYEYSSSDQLHVYQTQKIDSGSVNIIELTSEMVSVEFDVVLQVSMSNSSSTERRRVTGHITKFF